MYGATVIKLAATLRIPRTKARALYEETRNFTQAVKRYKELVGHRLPRGRMSMTSIDDVLRAAARARLVVLLDYVRDGETRVYKVAPYSYREDGRKFFGYDVLDATIKSFETAQIVRVELTAKRFIPKWDVEL